MILKPVIGSSIRSEFSFCYFAMISCKKFKEMAHKFVKRLNTMLKRLNTMDIETIRELKIQTLDPHVPGNWNAR